MVGLRDLKSMGADNPFQGSQRLLYNTIVGGQYSLVFMMGGPGCGKSTVVKQAQKALEEKHWTVVTTGLTAVAGSLLGGITTAKFFGIGVGNILPEGLEDEGSLTSRPGPKVLLGRSELAALKTEKLTVFVDEVSMMPTETLVVLVQILELWKNLKFKRQYQLVLVGDLRQMEPISERVKKGTTPPFKKFTSSILENARYQTNGSDEIIEYTSPLFGYPQQVGSDEVYKGAKDFKVTCLSLLSNYRANPDEQQMLRDMDRIGKGLGGAYPFSSYMMTPRADGSYVPTYKEMAHRPNGVSAVEAKLGLRLCASNKRVAEINDAALAEAKLNNPRLEVKNYTITCKEAPSYPGGPTALIDDIRGAIPVHMTLWQGCNVMVTINDRDSGLMNGSRGTISHLGKNFVTIETDDGQCRNLMVMPFFTPLDAAGNSYGEVLGLQCHPCYAMTVEKAQGSTFRDTLVIVELGCYPRHGRSLVALSRATRAQDVIFVAPPKAVAHSVTDPKYTEFIAQVEKKTFDLIWASTKERKPNVSVVHKGFYSSVYVTLGDNTYVLPHLVGELQKHKCLMKLSKGGTRQLIEGELEFCLKLVKDSGVELASKEAVKDLLYCSLKPILTWGQTVLTAVNKKHSKLDEEEATKYLVSLDSKLKLESTTKLKCLALTGEAIDSEEVMAASLFGGELPNCFSFNNYIGKEVHPETVITSLLANVEVDISEVLPVLELSKSLRALIKDKYAWCISLVKDGVIKEADIANPLIYSQSATATADTTPINVDAKELAKDKEEAIASEKVVAEPKTVQDRLVAYGLSKKQSVYKLRSNPSKVYSLMSIAQVISIAISYGLTDYANYLLAQDYDLSAKISAVIPYDPEFPLLATDLSLVPASFVANKFKDEVLEELLAVAK